MILRSSIALSAVLALGAARGEDAVDVSRYVALGDGLTAGFANGNLFDGATADPPQRLGQRESYPMRVAEALGTSATAPLVAWPGRPGRSLTIRDPDVGSLSSDVFLFGVTAGTGARTAPQERATVLAIPRHTAADAAAKRWDLDPTVPATVRDDEDMVLGLPWALEGEPPRSQLETALALEPTFATVWLGVDDLLRAARVGSIDGITPPLEFGRSLDAIVGALAARGVRGAVANVPDVTVMPYFVPHRELRRVLQREAAAHPSGTKPADVTGPVLAILFGVPRGAYVLATQIAFQSMREIDGGNQDAPLDRNHVLSRTEARRLRATARAYSAQIAQIAERHGWALVDLASTFRSWRRHGVDVGGRHLTNAYLGGLFDLTGQNLSPTGHALVATEFLRAIEARYGTRGDPPDVAAILAVDPLAPLAGAPVGGAALASEMR